MNKKYERDKELGIMRVTRILKFCNTKCTNKYRMIQELWKSIDVPQSLHEYKLCKGTKSEIDRKDGIQT